MYNVLNTILSLNTQLGRGLKKLYPAAAIAARIYTAQVFFMAGLSKIQDWDTTLFLFEEEYNVPLLPYDWAAVMGTTAELILPILLALGMLTRFSSLGLFVVNTVAVISLAEIAPAALYLHVIWGILLAQLSINGAGSLSVDVLLKDVRFVPQKGATQL